MRGTHAQSVRCCGGSGVTVLGGAVQDPELLSGFSYEDGPR